MGVRPLDARVPALAVGAIYALGYLYALGDIDWAQQAAWGFRVGDLALAQWITMRSAFYFEAVAIADIGHLAVLISPLNLAIAVGLASLLTLNIHGAIELRRRPALCRRRPGTLLGGLPALLAGGACCAPSLVLLLGVPGLGAFAALFGWLIPLSFAALFATRWWQRREGAPAWLWRSGQ